MKDKKNNEKENKKNKNEILKKKKEKGKEKDNNKIEYKSRITRSRKLGLLAKPGNTNKDPKNKSNYKKMRIFYSHNFLYFFLLLSFFCSMCISREIRN